jgi:predicted TIM-barrel fold metal-dependent hydrolase
MATGQFEIIDIHLHAWPKDMNDLHYPHKSSILDQQVFDDTLAQMDDLGISQGVLSGPNNITAEWCLRAPHRFIASWLPDPVILNPDEEAEKFKDAIDNQGFRGLGELFVQYYFGVAANDQRLFPLYRICQERNLPVFFHTGFNGPDYHRETPSFRVRLCDPLLLEDVIVAFPHLKIVMDHMSFPFTEQAIYMLLIHSNVYMDVATVNWCIGQAGFHRLLRQVTETVGTDKILFGSDQMNMPQMIPVGVNAIQEASFLSEDDKRKILGDNARKLLGINVAGEAQ